MVRFCDFAAFALVFAGLAGCGAARSPTAAQPPDGADPRDQLSRLVERYWDERQDPAQEAIAPQALADSLALERRYLAQISAISRASLNADWAVTYDMFKRGRESAIEGFTYPQELMPVNPFEGMPQRFARAAAGFGPAFSTVKDYDKWLQQIDDYTRWMNQAIVNLRDGVRRGYTLPRILVVRTLPLLARLAEDSPGSVFYHPLLAIPRTIGDPDRARLGTALTSAIRERILPATRRLLDYMQNEYLPRARDSVALTALPLGDPWYAYLVKRETGSALTPAEIHAIGLAEVERLRGRLQSLLTEISFAGDEAGYVETLRHDARSSYDSPDELLTAYKDLKARVTNSIPTLFSLIPRADFDIQGALPLRELASPPLWYRRAANGRLAVLYVNIADPAERTAIGMIPAFLREAVPGHHYQAALQQERHDLPRFRRYEATPAYVDGWGLYAVTLGEELGLYAEPQTRFTALLAQVSCASALVIDTGLHSQNWTRARALEYLHAAMPIDEDSAALRIDRMVALPAREMACMIGGLKLRALRVQAEQTMGPRFDIHAFHAEILKDGAMPLDILDTKLTAWAHTVQ